METILWRITMINLSRNVSNSYNSRTQSHLYQLLLTYTTKAKNIVPNLSLMERAYWDPESSFWNIKQGSLTFIIHALVTNAIAPPVELCRRVLQCQGYEHSRKATPRKATPAVNADRPQDIVILSPPADIVGLDVVIEYKARPKPGGCSAPDYMSSPIVTPDMMRAEWMYFITLGKYKRSAQLGIAIKNPTKKQYFNAGYNELNIRAGPTIPNIIMSA
ncbi:hypothetical protein V1505DRAFT_220261 [Lipomyces doorenjongii]